ncbi:YkvA family protein [Meiothermus cerbereus]|jgi:uncharacterized membrane protein YkvA (DUF1232 family)|uniref:YkvA family protein n=1 Tax=Meiothermus cerbereus TaxID=65552 RepID=UPI0006889D3D|nr:DUF1232 domain-containing protein [Meiothermus cerbereus]
MEELQRLEVTPIQPTERYSEAAFWQKLQRFARRAGRKVVEKALWLYYTLQEPSTPTWAKRTILGALVYFLVPLDAVADLAPLIGFTDDLSVLLLAAGTVAAHITPAIKERARRQASVWFGEAV